MAAFIRILIVSILENQSYWEELIPAVENSLGTARIIREEEAYGSQSRIDDDMIIIDVTGVSDLPKLVSAVRKSKPDAKILLAATTPTWREARQAFYLGATDYIRKQSNVEEMIATLKDSYAKSWKPTNPANNFNHFGRT